MVPMWQAGKVTKEYIWEFERYAQDMGMADKDMKVHLVSVLNQH